MVATAVGELGGGDVDDALTGAAGHLMHKAHKVLVGIAESHASSYATFKEARRTGEVEGDHTLILVPDVYHAVQSFVTALDGELTEQLVPHLCQLVEGGINSLDGSETGDGLMSFPFVDKCHVAGLRRDQLSSLFPFNIFY